MNYIWLSSSTRCKNNVAIFQQQYANKGYHSKNLGKYRIVEFIENFQQR